MHYFIDGYNFLFRILKKEGSLEKKRKEVLELLNEQSHLLSLNITIVFDSSEIGRKDSSRGHFDALEVIYTIQKQTADEYILKEIEASSHPTQEVVVTSDRELSGRSKQLGAKSLSIQQFLKLIVKKTHKKTALKSQRTFRESDREMQRLLKIFEERLNESL